MKAVVIWDGETGIGASVILHAEDETGKGRIAQLRAAGYGSASQVNCGAPDDCITVRLKTREEVIGVH